MNSDTLAEIRFPSSPDRLCLVRVLVKRAAEFAGCDNALAEKLVIAVNEACMNIIQHAYRGVDSGDIILEIRNSGPELQFRLRDYAEPIDLKSVKSRKLEEIRPGGLGVHFIGEIMDEWKMGHLENGTGNYLEMIKKIDPAPDASGTPDRGG